MAVGGVWRTQIPFCCRKLLVVLSVRVKVKVKVKDKARVRV
jgi:hypothetical protein